ncbi:MAG: GNAT family protein [Candidatus Magasanikiibacteriota bacterium]
MKGPILKGPRVILRPIKVSDAPNYVRWFSDKEVRIHFNYNVWDVSEKEEKKFIRKSLKNKNQILFAIIYNGKHIGGSGLDFDWKSKRASWGIIIGEKDEWGKGIAGEVIKLLLEYGFKKWKLNRIDLEVEMLNKRALKAYKKAGFKLEGVIRQGQFNPQLKSFIDKGIMGILKEEWLKKYKK